MKRYEGSITFRYFFRGIPVKTLVRPYETLCFRMPNGVTTYAMSLLTKFEKSRVRRIYYSVAEPYEPVRCETCNKPHDCGLDAWLCCEARIDGESDLAWFDRVVARRLAAHTKRLNAALEFVGEGDTIPYDVATDGIVLEGTH